MDSVDVCIIANSCRDIMKALQILDTKIPRWRRAMFHLFIAFKLRDIIVATSRYANIDNDLKDELMDLNF